MKHFLALALLLLCTPAIAGNSEIPKTPACGVGAMVVRETELLFVPLHMNYFFAQAQARKLLKEMKLKEPCELKGRVRSRSDGKCYFPARLP